MRLLLLLLALPCACLAWTPSPSRSATASILSRTTTTTTTTRLHNVPPSTDPVAVKALSDRESPPASFYELQINCARAAKLAMKDGHQLLEVEFPPLPQNVLEMDDVSAYQVASANLDLAIQFSKNLAAVDGTKVAIMFPDEAELDIQLETLGTSTPHPNIVLSSLRKSEEGDDRLFKPEQILLSLFGNGSSGSVKKMDGVNVYVCLVASAQELPDIEELHTLDPDATIILYNLKLDILRGDLGAPAFPSKVRDSYTCVVAIIYMIQCPTHTNVVPFSQNYDDRIGLSRSLFEQGQAGVLPTNSTVQSFDGPSALHGQLSGVSVSELSWSISNVARYGQWKVPSGPGQ